MEYVILKTLVLLGLYPLLVRTHSGMALVLIVQAKIGLHVPNQKFIDPRILVIRGN